MFSRTCILPLLTKHANANAANAAHLHMTPRGAALPAAGLRAPLSLAATVGGALRRGFATTNGAAAAAAVAAANARARVGASGLTLEQGGHSSSSGIRNTALFFLMATAVGLIAYHSFTQLRTSDIFNDEKEHIADVVAELKKEEYVEEERRLAKLRQQAYAANVSKDGNKK